MLNAPMPTVRRIAVAVAVGALAILAHRAPARAAGCPDCNADGSVAINELITGIAIALGDSALAACPSFDGDANGSVTIDELVAGIDAALSGCAATPTPTVSPTPTPLDPGPPPTEPDALLLWLQAGSYGAWAAESAPHQSTGPHGGRVRTFLNPALFDSLTAGQAQHPAGAVAVKELYLNSQRVRGWAVMVKLADDSDGGRNWYWYEYFGSGEPFSGNGLGICTGCHSTGRDYVRIPFPLS
jgi:hypothetical protein